MATLDTVIDEAVRAWPALAHDRPAFAAHLARVLDPAAEVHAGDLLLAFAAMHGVEDAWRELDTHLANIPAAVARVDASPAFGDEVRQRVAEKLLGPEGKLGAYSGRGPLGGWLRIVALREAQSLARSRRGTDDTELGQLVAADNDPELALLKRQSAETFRRAYAAVLSSLDAETRTTLRLYFVEELTYEQLGRVLQCSRATAARRVDDARERLLDGVHDAIRSELGAGAPGAETLFALVESQLQMSVLRHFGKTG